MKNTIAVLLFSLVVSPFARAGESPFPFVSEKLFKKLADLTEDWKDHKNDDQVKDDRRNAMKLYDILGANRLIPSSGYNRLTKTGDFDIVTSHPIPHVYRYHVENGVVTYVDVIENENKKSPIYDKNNPAIMTTESNNLQRDFVEYCGMIKKGEQLPKEIKGGVSTLSADDSKSVEKIIRTVVDNYGGQKTALSDSKIGEFRKSLFKAFQDAKIFLGDKTPESLVSIYRYEHSAIGGWPWSREHMVTDEYLEVKLPNLRQRYAYGGDHLGVITSVRDIEGTGFHEIVFSEDEMSCNKGQLKKAYQAYSAPETVDKAKGPGTR